MSTNMASAPQRYARVLACAICQHRKVKCDRKDPCSNCIKANVPCTSSTPAPMRRRRRPNQDLRERLARCEELLLQCAGTDGGPATQSAKGLLPLTPATNGAPAPEASTSQLTSDSSPQTSRPAGMMVQHEGGPRLMDCHIWASIYDELQSMRDIVETEDGRDVSVLDHEDAIPDSSADLLLSGDDPRIRVKDLQPDPVHIIHASTVQPYVMEAAADIGKVTLQNQALLFSIYTMAIVSLLDHDCVAMFEMSRHRALQKFTLGAKLSLIRFNFLKNYDMAALQALILFLWSLQGRFDRYRAWIISGIILRIAQKAGYHRDGKLLNLSPFETEMRRRIWWQIFVQDSTHAMASGLSPSLLPVNWDTKEPQNLNDADLFLNSTEPVHPRQGPTEMAFCLVLHRVYKLTAETTNFAGGTLTLGEAILGQTPDGKDTADGIQTTLSKFRDATDELDRAIRDLEERYVNPEAGNAHVAALTIRPMLMKKLDGMVPIQGRPGFGSEISIPEDNIFRTLLASLEHGCEAYEQMAAYRFEWSIKPHFRLDKFAALTGQLCHRLTGPLSDRGWKVVEKIYEQHPELFDMTQKQHFAQAQYTLKAWKARETAIVQAGQIVERPAFIAQLQKALLALNSNSQSCWQSTLATPSAMDQQMAGLDQLVEEYGPSEQTWSTWVDSLTDLESCLGQGNIDFRVMEHGGGLPLS
ncbi:putative transcriptional regulatory protein [Tolypocladium ophioglossoides CBS 100239]|uniref:Putative transcriptional regulatory protein n=1 Tax=Tolypocladium ophioglossoides (strain CBS 100239) TaxID=1163406 RepID=A0A0L0MX46_TOLOC|nr:putative transcriptional regulatory protein [Tolypocladium ophioglossoides CBS 100239]